MIDRIYNILVKVYGRWYDYALCEAMAEFIADQINHNGFRTRRDIQGYLHANTQGGTLAEAASTAIQREFPSIIKDN